MAIFKQLSPRGKIHIILAPSDDPYTAACGRICESDGQVSGPPNCKVCINAVEPKLAKPPNKINHRCYICNIPGFTEQGLWRHKTYNQTHIKLVEAGARLQESLDSYFEAVVVPEVLIS